MMMAVSIAKSLLAHAKKAGSFPHGRRTLHYVQREIKIALDKADEKLVDDIYIVPILLDDDAQIPDQIKGIQVVKASDGDCIEQVDDAIRYQLDQLGESIAKAQVGSNLRWSRVSYKDSWDGLPGYR